MKFSFFLFLSLILMSQQCKDPVQNEKAADEPTECVDSSKIKKDAACVMLYKPVCGCNGITYSNDCVASSQGVLNWTEGECDSSRDSASI